jgi:Uma2 family endonuclease
MIAIAPTPLCEQQHLVIDDVSWDFYEQVLNEICNRAIRATYSRGSIEIMPPLPEHELPKKAVGRLIETLTPELRIAMTPYGSTTFRREDRTAGLEPDECYYLQNAGRVRGMKRFDPSVHPAPDLAVEIDITSRSIPRQPVYAELGVPELWKFNGRELLVLKLHPDGKYRPVPQSTAFPFLPLDGFARFVHRMLDEEQTAVLCEFRDWVRTLRMP